MKTFAVISILLLVIVDTQATTVPFRGLFDVKKQDHQPKGSLNPQNILTLTIVTGSLANAQLVSDYFSSLNQITVFDVTDTHIKVKGSVAQFSQVFNTTFVEYKCPIDTSLTCFATTSEVFLPQSLLSAIVGILGLEQIVFPKPNLLIGDQKSLLNSRLSSTFPYFLGPQAATVYGAPSSTGMGIKVGYITLGGYFTQSDLDTYFTQNSLGTAPTINIVYIDGATQDLTDSETSVQNYLDIEIIASVAPKAKITIYFAPASLQGFYNSINAAIKKNNIVAVSWAIDEQYLLLNQYTSLMDSFQKLFSKYRNVPVFCGTGGRGSAPGVSFPASCPNAIGCGGTDLNYASGSITSVSTYVSETGCSDSNGGYSRYFRRPSYQTGIHTNAYRGVPDLSANGNPNSGYKVCFTVSGTYSCYLAGGTAAASSLYVGITARLMNLNGVSHVQKNFVNGGYYKTLSFHDITSGSNGNYTASKGWDAVTGMGSFAQYTPKKPMTSEESFEK